jgi:hypothetical protein
MNEGDESFPSIQTWKRRRCSRFRNSSKKALKCSRAINTIAKSRGFELTSVRNDLLYASALSSEFDIIGHHDCATGSSVPPLLESVDELEGEGKAGLSVRPPARLLARKTSAPAQYMSNGH